MNACSKEDSIPKGKPAHYLQRLQVKINKFSGDTDKKEKASSSANSVTVQGEADGHDSTTKYGTHSS
jgi:hypothetical protein